MTRRAWVVSLVSLGAAAIATAAVALPQLNKARSNCPGQIVCPLTGELVCKDRCPLGAENPANEGPKKPCCPN
jgi:hypothetical protein